MPVSFAETTSNLTILYGTASSLHVGLPVPTIDGPFPSDFRTLQHLANILVTYEQKIRNLHALSRRAWSIATGFDFVANADNFSEAIMAENLINEDSFECNDCFIQSPSPTPPPNLTKSGGKKLSCSVTGTTYFHARHDCGQALHAHVQ